MSHGVHSVNSSETKGFTEHVNEVLGNDADLKNLKQVPMNPDSDEIFKNVAESIILPKMIESIRPGTIDKKSLPLNQTSVLLRKLQTITSQLMVAKRSVFKLLTLEQVICKMVLLIFALDFFGN